MPRSATRTPTAANDAIKAVAPRPRIAKPKPTAEERRAARDAANAAARAAREAEIAAFEANRPALFNALMVKAMRVALISANYPVVRESNSWWFEGFSVDARGMSFQTEATLGYGPTTVENLRIDDPDRLGSTLDMALQWFDDYDAEQERLRQAALAKQIARDKAIAKLDPADRVALDLDPQTGKPARGY